MHRTLPQNKHTQAIREVAAGGGIQALSQMDIAGLRQLLEQAFTSVDTDGSGQLALDQGITGLGQLLEEAYILKGTNGPVAENIFGPFAFLVKLGSSARAR
eukprot:1141055-Pelagomonas_calceolata.AAC.1